MSEKLLHVSGNEHSDRWRKHYRNVWNRRSLVLLAKEAESLLGDSVGPQETTRQKRLHTGGENRDAMKEASVLIQTFQARDKSES